jgi:hypothetical protein
MRGLELLNVLILTITLLEIITMLQLKYLVKIRSVFFTVFIE